MFQRRHLWTLLLAAVLIGATFGAAAAQQTTDGTEPLFIPAEDTQTAQKDLEQAVTRTRKVAVNWSTLSAALPGSTVELNLFDDVNIQTVIASAATENGVTTWIGQVPNDPLAHVFMVSSDGQVAADIISPDGLYQVRPDGDGLYAVQQVDQTAYPDEIPPIEVTTDMISESALVNADPAASADVDDGSTIDVLVLYTPRARSAANGAGAMANLINLAVTETNQSYANSGISQRLRLVHLAQTDYTESGSMQNDLSYLRDSLDSYMNEAHQLRNTYSADLVSLIVESTEYCGIAYVMGEPASYFAEYGFSVVARNCATGNYSFAHELGHNMGANHDWFVSASAIPNAYGHGYVNVSARWRTIMAYNNECVARGTTCTRLPYWANPDIQRNGAPMGVPAGTNATCRAGDPNHPRCDADTRRTLNTNAYTIANFRASKSGPSSTPIPLSSFNYLRFLPLLKR